jgi:predicted DsbA family dithiol-disulfide isomerase
MFKKKGLTMDVKKVMADLKAVAAKEGLEMGDRLMAYNSRLAQEAGLWAETKDPDHTFHMETFKAYFVDGKNIAQPEVLLDLIKNAGLDPVEGAEIIENRTFASAVDSDWELSKKAGVMAAPTFMIGLDRLVGAQPYAALARFVERHKESGRK